MGQFHDRVNHAMKLVVCCQVTSENWFCRVVAFPHLKKNACMTARLLFDLVADFQRYF